MKMERRYGLRTAVRVALSVVAIWRSRALGSLYGTRPRGLAAFCLVSLVYMAFNSWALLFAIAVAENRTRRTRHTSSVPGSEIVE